MHAGRLRMYALMAERPNVGIGVFEIMGALTKEGIAPRRETVYGWLRDDVRMGTAEKLGGERGAARYRLKNRSQ